MDDENMELEQITEEVVQETTNTEEVIQDTIETETAKSEDSIEENGIENEEDVVIENTLSIDIYNELVTANENLVNIETIIAEPPLTIWDKPIDDYTPTEGILLIIMFILLARLIFDFVGGILCVK